MKVNSHNDCFSKYMHVTTAENTPAEERSSTRSLKLAKSNHFLIEIYKDSVLARKA